jgi:hypothetical protein
LFQLRFRQVEPLMWDRARRGCVSGFSRASRRRLMVKLNSISVAAPLPAFVALTFPDDCFPVTGKVAKICLDNFLKRLVRVAPGACGLWRMEWQRRKSGIHEGEYMPHFHLLIWGVPFDDFPVGDLSERKVHRRFYVNVEDRQLVLTGIAEARSWAKLKGKPWPALFNCLNFEDDIEECGHFALSFSDWCSSAWYHVVGSHNLDHLVVGTRVECVESWAGVSCYCAKYFSKESWDDEPSGSGRLWGIFNRSCIPWANIIDIELSSSVGCRLRRVARRYLEHVLGRRVRAGYGITVYCDASRWLQSLLGPRRGTPF